MEVEEEAGKKKKRTYDYGRYSVRVVVVSRHEARSVLSSLRGLRTETDRSLIQLWYMAIIALQPRLPSVIPVDVSWQLMNKANSGVMSPFRNALSKVFDGSLSLRVSGPSLHLRVLPRRAPSTMGYQNALPFGTRGGRET